MGIGVEITEQENVVGLRRVGDDRVRELEQAAGLVDPISIEEALAVGGLGAGSALRLEVVGDNREGLRCDSEGLSDRLAGVEPDRLVDLGETGTDRAGNCFFVDDRGGDEIGRGNGCRRRELSRGGHECPDIRPRGGIQTGYQISDRGVCWLTELDAVLDLLESDDVGAEARDRGDRFAALDLELSGSGSSSGVAVDRRERGEVVEHVEIGNADVTTDDRGCRRARVHRGEGRLVLRRARVGDRNGGLEAPVGESVAEHIRLSREVDGVTRAHDRRGGEVGLRADVGGSRDLDVVAVIEEKSLSAVARLDLRGGRVARIRRLGALDQPLGAGGEPEGAEVEELMCRCDRVRAGRGHELALECLAGATDDGVGERRRDGDIGCRHSGFRRDELDRRLGLEDDVVVRDGPARCAAELSLPERLAHLAGGRDPIAEGERRGVGAEIDEDAVRRAGRGIRSPAAARGLHDDATVAARTAVVSGDDAVDGLHAADKGAGAVDGDALNGGDGLGRRGGERRSCSEGRESNRNRQGRAEHCDASGRSGGFSGHVSEAPFGRRR